MISFANDFCQSNFKFFLMKMVKIYLSVLMLCFFSFAGFSQSSLLDAPDLRNLKIDACTDDQLSSMMERAKQSNIGELEFYELVRQKGLPDEELEKLKYRALFLNKSNTDTKQNVDDIKKEKSNQQFGRFYDKDANQTMMIENNRDLSVFGAELFARNSLVFEPNLRIPTPSSYVLGPDDEVILTVYGMSEKKYNLEVNEEGEIYIPNVGPLFVSGLSIEQATQKVRSKLSSTIYKAMNSGQTKMQMSLGKIRSIRVTVIGQAQKPGTFTVSSLTTLYNVLYLCGGPGPKGSYRSIELIRGNQVKKVADLYAFLVKGDQKDNVLLQEGDVIRIPYYKNMVKVSGNVKREGKYEMLENETFDKLLEYSGGFDDNAYKTSVTVTRITDTGKIVIDVNKSQFANMKSAGGDEYLIRKNRNDFSSRVNISGSVFRPGNYELTEGLTLKELINKSGGVKEDAYTKSSSVFRVQKNKTPTIFNVNIDSVLNHGQTVFLQNEDSVSIHSIFDFRDSMYVNIEGYVRKPIQMKWRDSMRLRDVVMAAGGLTEFGDSANIEISRRIKSADVNSINHPEAITKIVNLSNNFVLEPFDRIIVKGIVGYVNQRTVMLVGDIKIPGKYILQTSGDRLSDIINRAQGFKASADSNAVTIRRPIKSNLSLRERETIFQRLLNIDNDSLASNQKLRDEIYKSYELISVNLEKALERPNSSENLLLEDGDIITIDKNTNLVKISGDVYYPTIIPYKKGKSAKYYIRQAGNFTSNAKKSGTVVIYPDGKAKGVKSFLFFKIYPRVTPRSEIFIPQKPKSNHTKISPGELAIVFSALGIIAQILTSIIK
ncbi:MAG: hypothetical protein FGM46_06145 [Ferruginibacter sp.]|nr:hypothetical protein [Ferruginibacter sp.]